MENIFDVLSVVVAIAAAAAFAFVFIKGIMELMKKDRFPITTIEAKVSGKREDRIETGRKPKRECYATFKNSNGMEKELRLTPAEYDILNDGDKGVLIFRGDVLLSFEVKNQSQSEANDTEEKSDPEEHINE